MTDDELRKLAEAAIAGERFMTDDDGRRVSLREIMGEPPDPAPDLARAVLRLLTTIKVMRGAHVSDPALASLRARYETIQEEIEVHDKRWGGAVDDMLSDIDQLRQQRDELARYKAAVKRVMSVSMIGPAAHCSFVLNVERELERKS